MHNRGIFGGLRGSQEHYKGSEGISEGLLWHFKKFHRIFKGFWRPQRGVFGGFRSNFRIHQRIYGGFQKH